MQENYGGESAKFVKQQETVQMTAAKNILGCSSTTSNVSTKSRTRNVLT